MFFQTADEKKNRLCFYLRSNDRKRRAIPPTHTSHCDRGWIFAEKNDSLVIGKMEKNNEFSIYPLQIHIEKQKYEYFFICDEIHRKGICEHKYHNSSSIFNQRESIYDVAEPFSIVIRKNYRHRREKIQIYRLL